MSIESDAASQVASIYTKGIEEAAHVAVKIGGEVFEISKELAVILFRAIAMEDFKRSGKISLHNMLRKAAQTGTDLHVVTVKDKEQFEKVSKEFKSGSVLFARGRGKDNYNVIFGEDNAPLVNRALKNLELNIVDGEVVSEVKNANNKAADMEELSFDDDNVKISDKLTDYEISKSNDEGINIASHDLKSSNHYEDYTAEQALNLDNAKEYDDPDKIVKDIQKAQQGNEHPLAKDGEAAAPSKKKSAAEKSSDKVKTSIHKKLADKKAERAANAKEALTNAKDSIKDSITKAADGIKDIGGK